MKVNTQRYLTVTLATGLLWLGSSAVDAVQKGTTSTRPKHQKHSQGLASPSPAETPGTDQAFTEPSLEGSWSITFYLEPEHTEGATQCVVFTTTNSAPSGEEGEGTWTSPSFTGWQGAWQQDGDHIQWYGFTDAVALATSEFGHLPNNTIISGEFNHFLPPEGVTSSAGGWVAKRVDDCASKPMSAKLAAPENSEPDPAVKSTQ